MLIPFAVRKIGKIEQWFVERHAVLCISSGVSYVGVSFTEFCYPTFPSEKLGMFSSLLSLSRCFSRASVDSSWVSMSSKAEAANSNDAEEKKPDLTDQFEYALFFFFLYGFVWSLNRCCFNISTAFFCSSFPLICSAIEIEHELLYSVLCFLFSKWRRWNEFVIELHSYSLKKKKKINPLYEKRDL